jgi:hypothetical protein
MNKIHPASFPASSLRRFPALLACLTIALALCACSSVKTRVDNGRVTARTFSFLNTGRQLPSYAEERAEAHTMVQQATSPSRT